MSDMSVRFYNKRDDIRFISLLALFFVQVALYAQTNVPLRRSVSSSSPMWLVHIDTWIYPDPQKCIDLIPADVRPYIVMNISLSVSDFVYKKYPYTIAESWLRTCAQNRMWAMIQPASGYKNNLSNTEIGGYEYFYQQYPNFLGFNFAEQCWGFSTNANWLERLRLFSNLIKLGNKYGGYLIVSSAQTMSTPQDNAIGMMKLSSDFAAASKSFKQNFILLEKYTTTRGFYDVESTCLGAFLSGHSGQYGIRFDNCGWLKSNGRNFPEASGISPVLEHFLLTGQTVHDGPEISYNQALYSNGTDTTSDGFISKRFAMKPQFTNITLDILRKIIDKTIRIPNRIEVIARTKIAVIADLTGGSNRDLYSTPQSLFTGLYAMDGEWDTNNTWFKKSGRYPAIPIVYQSDGSETGSFHTTVTKSGYAQRWPTIQDKVNEFNSLFPTEYKGDMYVSRMNNSWITYNPYLDSTVTKFSSATIPLKYNTCDSIYLCYQPYDVGVINESKGTLQFYLNNYCTASVYGMRTDTIRVYGCLSTPTYSFVDRGMHSVSTVLSAWKNGVFTISVKHNGPVDLIINCSGSATRRLTKKVSATITPPAIPPVYAGELQFESENFDYKNIAGTNQKITAQYTAMGYLAFGTDASAVIRDTVTVLRGGVYQLNTRYSASNGDVRTVDLYVNGTKVVNPTFTKTASDSTWSVNRQWIKLNVGHNVIMYKANATGLYNINFDNIILYREGPF